MIRFRSFCLALLILLTGQAFGQLIPINNRSTLVPTLPHYLQAYAQPGGGLRPGPAVSPPGRKYLLYEEGGLIPGWELHFQCGREFYPNGAIAKTYRIAWNKPLDTLEKEEYAYNPQGALLTYDYYAHDIGLAWPLEILAQEAYSYNGQGQLQSLLYKSFNSITGIYDTVRYYRYQHETDVQGRISVAYTDQLNINYDIDFITGDTTRTRTIDSTLRDSVHYLSATSQQVMGYTRYEASSGTYVPQHREQFLLDSLTGRPAEWNSYYHFIIWEPEVTRQYRALPNGNTYCSQYTYDPNMQGLLTRVNMEISYEHRLDGAGYPQRTFNLYKDFHELDNITRLQLKEFNYTNGATSLSIERDSLTLDANNRVLARARFTQSSNDTTASPPESRAIKYVFTELGLTGIRPSSAPQTLAIAPGPSNKTVLLPALPTGTWKATVIDMQGHSTTLGNPDKSGIITMPNLATGVYSLHLKDERGRHLHGRFVWER